jgi:hypothetical protein
MWVIKFKNTQTDHEHSCPYFWLRVAKFGLSILLLGLDSSKLGIPEVKVQKASLYWRTGTHVLLDAI